MHFKYKTPLLIIFFALIFVAGFVLFSSNTEKTDEEKPVISKPVKAITPREFGLSLDSFNVEKNKVKRNEFLSTILQRYQIDLIDIAKISEKSKTILDVRDITAGKSYSIFADKTGTGKAAYFVYRPNPVDYVVYDLRDTLRVYSGKKKVSSKTQTVAGVIDYSLYETFIDENADPELSMKLADIYAWAIDFYAVQKGDWFKIQYEQRYVDGEPIGTGRIASAVFSHEGEIFRAFYFQPDSTSVGEYYDGKGKSLRKAFLKSPLKFSRITSHYTKRRFHPVQKRWKAHLGTDYAAPSGTPILATGNGEVIASQYSKYNGNYVKIKHNSTYTTQYLHMSKRAVSRGEHVKQGEVIGYVGSTGLATGPHVCYRFWKNGKQVNHLKQHFPPAKPIAENQRMAFLKVVSQQVKTLVDVKLKTEKKTPLIAAVKSKKEYLLTF